jgi:hypothetical protein
MKKKSAYDLTGPWWEWVHSSPGQVRAAHTALYLWLVELNNRLLWIEQFAAPAELCCNAMGVRYNAYKRIMDDLVLWGFVEIRQQAVNQYTANIIALTILDKATVKATVEARIKAKGKQQLDQRESNGESKDDINKQDTNVSKTIKQENEKTATPPPSEEEGKSVFQKNHIHFKNNFWSEENQANREAVMMIHRGMTITEHTFDEFNNHLTSSVKNHLSYSSYIQHFNSWYRIINQSKSSKNGKEPTGSNLTEQLPDTDWSQYAARNKKSAPRT